MQSLPSRLNSPLVRSNSSQSVFIFLTPTSALCAQRIANCGCRASVASFPLQDTLSERCVISLIGSFKDFDATLVLLDLNQPPKLRLEPGTRIRDERGVEVADPLVHPRLGKLIFDALKSRQRRHTGLERSRRGRPVGPEMRPQLHQVALC